MRCRLRGLDKLLRGLGPLRWARGKVKRRILPSPLTLAFALLVLSIPSAELSSLRADLVSVRSDLAEISPISPPVAPSRAEAQIAFLSLIFDDTQELWRRTFTAAGKPYLEARSVFFRGAIQSACDRSEPGTGSFYCPIDRTVYLDLDLVQKPRGDSGASWYFAQAHILAHEMGHHVQTISGTELGARRLQASQPADSAHEKIHLELQADCLAALWWRSAVERGVLAVPSAQETLPAAVLPERLSGATETLAHGSSTQRIDAFKRGLSSTCDLEIIRRRSAVR